MALLEKGDFFADLVLAVKIPEVDNANAVARWMLDQAIIVYQVT